MKANVSVKYDRRRKYYLVLDCESATLPCAGNLPADAKKDVAIACRRIILLWQGDRKEIKVFWNYHDWRFGKDRCPFAKKHLKKAWRGFVGICKWD